MPVALDSTICVARQRHVALPFRARSFAALRMTAYSAVTDETFLTLNSDLGRCYVKHERRFGHAAKR
jgi:hypothetical protein